MSSVTFLQAFANGPGGNTNYTINFGVQPAGTLLVLGHISNQFFLSIDAGWTQLGTDTFPYTFYKVANGTETSVTVNVVASGFIVAALIAVYSVGTPQNKINTPTGSTNTQTSDTHSSVPAAAASIAIFAARDDLSTTQLAVNSLTGTSWVNTADAHISNGGTAQQLALCIASNVVSTGSVNGATITWNQSLSTLGVTSFYAAANQLVLGPALLSSI